MNIEFQQVMEHFKSIPGAISFTEAIATMLVIKNELQWIKNPGIAVDLGTHLGKIASAMSYMLATIPSSVTELCLVDPLFDLYNDKEWERHYVKLTEERKPEGWSQIHDDHNEVTMSNVTKLAPNLKITPYGLSSLTFFEVRTDPIALMMVDSGDHLPDVVFDEIEVYKDRIMENGLVFFHDYKNQFIYPAEGLQKLCSDYGFEEINMPWEEAEGIAASLSLEEKDNNSWLNYGGTIKYYNFMGCCRKI